MDNDWYKKLALTLVNLETEEEVEQVLRKYDFWQDDDENWQVIDEGRQNFSTIGNQQDSADIALTEKIVNAVDAVMINECLKQGIDPTSDRAPKSIAEAQKKFFNIYNGNLANIDPHERAHLAESILFVVTGEKNNPSYSIIDKGEGQSADAFKNTFLSLNRGNKNKIKFVQGKFGMGGTGVLTFGSPQYNLQLIISRRNPSIPKIREESQDDRWGMTVIRRRRPRGGMRSSVYTYLAPANEIISFRSQSLPLLPGDYPQAYERPLEYGSLIKLYEYQMVSRLRAQINLDLYYRLSLLLPNIALPVGLYERRASYSEHSQNRANQLPVFHRERRAGYSGHSQNTILSGLSVRLDEDKINNLESPEPFTGQIEVEGERINYSIYVFHRGKRSNYTKSDGIIFTLDGKLHASLSQSFFRRRTVGMSYLADSILVIVDCSKLSGNMVEELFMNSRDRLRNTEISRKITDRLEGVLANHGGLKALREKRSNEERKRKFEELGAVKEVLQDMINKSSSLRSLLALGERIKNPYDLGDEKEKRKFEGKEYPTYFELVKKFPSNKPKRCPINCQEFRIEYRTDAQNDYFDRAKDPGRFFLKVNDELISGYSFTLYNGKMVVLIEKPYPVNVGDLICYESELEDTTRPLPFSARFYIEIDRPKEADESNNGDPSKRKRKELAGLNLPGVHPVKKEDWDRYRFNKESALRVVDRGEGRGYDFYINVDNVYLHSEIKQKPDRLSVLKTRYINGMVILGMSLLNSYQNVNKQQNMSTEERKAVSSEEDSEEKVAEFAKAIAPALLPMIASLGDPDIAN